MFELKPKSREDAVIKGDKWRFTILTDSLVRIEYSEDGKFEDRATQVVIDRDFDVPKYTINEDREDFIKITTEALEITYTKKPFSKYSFCIKRICDGGFYYYDDILWGAMPGTAKTLDLKEDDVELEGSIMGGWFNVLDDSESAVLSEDGMVEDRKREGCVDRYIFGYGHKNFEALSAYYKLTGKTPLIPRFALGNWWSRYHKYTQSEYIELMDRFKAENIPFSVAVIDMDWHITEVEPKYGRGWTGYTWNEEYFPNYKEFLAYLHKNNLKVTLNLHPADGVYAYEKMYKEMAKELGVDYENEERISFDIRNKKFADAYFKYLHHPYEGDGVDFWWIDWQQGDSAMVDNVTALWMLNHLHYLDNCRNGKRGLILSRYAGPGSHRYPIGFSGDAVISWKALNFQPYFTATASNIGYTWWSHDIGGHTWGYRDEELQVRWVQLGVFSPINRLHSAPGPFTRKEPWTYREENGKIISKYLRLRHSLIPYLYAMNYLTHTKGIPLVCPMYYYDYTKKGEDIRNEYYFGTEMIAAPITCPMDKELRMGKSVAYLPEGKWFDFFTGKEYEGGRKYNVYRDDESIPVFVKGGGIIPLDGGRENINDVSNPENLLIKVYPYSDNSFSLYEDDGESLNYQKGSFLNTVFELNWDKEVTFTINAKGDTSVVPKNRRYCVEFVNIEQAAAEVYCDGKEVSALTEQKGDFTVCICPGDISKEIIIKLSDIKIKEYDKMAAIEEILCRAEIPIELKSRLYCGLQEAEDGTAACFSMASEEVSKELICAIMEVYSAE